MESILGHLLVQVSGISLLITFAAALCFTMIPNYFASRRPLSDPNVKLGYLPLWYLGLLHFAIGLYWYLNRPLLHVAAAQMSIVAYAGVSSIFVNLYWQIVRGGPGDESALGWVLRRLYYLLGALLIQGLVCGPSRQNLAASLTLYIPLIGNTLMRFARIVVLIQLTAESRD